MSHAISPTPQNSAQPNPIRRLARAMRLQIRVQPLIKPPPPNAVPLQRRRLCLPWLSFPQGICFCFLLLLFSCRCSCFCFLPLPLLLPSPFLVVIPAGNLLLLFALAFALAVSLAFAFCRCLCSCRCRSLVVIPAGNLLPPTPPPGDPRKRPLRERASAPGNGS